MGDFWYLLPIGFCASALHETFRARRQREKSFPYLAKVNMTEATAAKSFNILFGLANFTSIGLIISDIISRIIGSALLFRRRPFKSAGGDPDFLKLRNYPILVMPAELLSLLSKLIIIWFLALAYPMSELGKFWLAYGLTSLILHTLSNSLQPVITQRLREHSEDGNSINIEKLIAWIFILSGVTFITLGLMPNSVYEFYLGAAWQNVGYYIKLIAVWYIFHLAEQILENQFFVLAKEKKVLWLNLIDLILQVVLMTIGYLMGFSLYLFLGFFVLVKVILSIIKVSIIARNLSITS